MVRDISCKLFFFFYYVLTATNFGLFLMGMYLVLVVATNMQVPDESVLQTLAYASPWRDHSVWQPAAFPMPVRPERWDADKCGSGPCSLSIEDIDEMFRMGFEHPDFATAESVPMAPKTFARKFDPWDDSQYNYVDNKLGNELIFGLNETKATMADTWWWKLTP